MKKEKATKTCTYIGGQAVMEGVMMKLMYEVPSEPKIKKVTITKDYVNKKTDTPIYEYSE